ncbi:MAG: type II toxin-antitoxin system RelE/ParE family toxin [Verrucomicrobia bacterium]|nr:type II toxin-antitoxin system RelE/ParE family toxin [Verrucomicrobiota bacterium]
MRKVNFYTTAGGRAPVQEFLDALPPKAARKVLWVLQAIEDLPRVPEQYLKKLTGTRDIWEVRADFASDSFRLLGFWEAGHLIIVTNGFAKKTQKTPPGEIRLAEARRLEHFNRKFKP